MGGNSMALNEQQKLALKQLLSTLLGMDEPEAILATLRRVAERQAHSGHPRRGLRLV
jgi:hypothetical protein